MQMIESERALQTGQQIAVDAHHPDSVELTYPSHPLGTAGAEAA